MEFIDAQEMAQEWGDDARDKLKFAFVILIVVSNL